VTRRQLTEYLDLVDEFYDLGAFGRERNARARGRRDRFKRRVIAALYRAARGRARRTAPAFLSNEGGKGTIGVEGSPVGGHQAKLNRPGGGG